MTALEYEGILSESVAHIQVTSGRGSEAAWPPVLFIGTVAVESRQSDPQAGQARR